MMMEAERTSETSGVLQRNYTALHSRKLSSSGSVFTQERMEGCMLIVSAETKPDIERLFKEK
jgi:hypothetical protein